MDFQLLISNITNPTLLFFLLGILAVMVKSDLVIPESISKFISLYLLFAIGFKGGQELSHSSFTMDVFYSVVFGLIAASVIPLYTFFLLKRRMQASDAAAVAAAYGSVSAVTFVSAASFLDFQQVAFGGHMVAVMALMESPAIIVGIMLLMKYEKDENNGGTDLKTAIHHSLTNGSVLLILGSLIIGMISDVKQAEGIKPFTNDIFKGFLAIFLLEMGMVTAKKIGGFRKYGLFALAFALVIPAVNGIMAALLSKFVTSVPGDRFILAILSASASYIAVPAAMRLAAPKANPGLYISMALGITFPFNITIGMPLYFYIINLFQ